MKALTHRERWVLALLTLAALALRWWFVQQYEALHPLSALPVIDERSYDCWARAIAAGDWLGSEVFFQEPLYSYALALVYKLSAGSLHAARIAQAAVGALTVPLVFLLAHRLFGRASAWIAAVGWCVYKPALLLCALLLKENLYAPLLCASLLVLVGALDSGRRFWLVGVLAGLGALLRGNGLLLIPLFALAPWWPWSAALAGATRSARLRACAVLLCGVLGVLLPVALRNLQVGGVFALTTSGAGTNVYGGNNLDNPYGRATEFDWVRGIPEYEARDWQHEAERRSGRPLDPTQVSRFWLAEVGHSLRAEPLAHLSILWNKLRLTLGPYEVPDNHSLDWDARYVPLLALPLPGFRCLGWLGLAGLLCCLAPRRLGGPGPEGAAGRLLAVAALAYLGTVVLTVTSDRIRIALVPLLLPFAGWIASSLWLRVRAAAGSPWPLLGTSLVASALFAWVQVFDAAERAQDLDKRDYNLMVYRLSEPDGLEEAERLARALAARHPGTPQLESSLAQIEARRAGAAREATGAQPEDWQPLYKSALAHLELALNSPQINARERFRAQKLAGLLLFEIANWSKAEPWLRAALEFDPQDRDLRLTLASTLVLLVQSEASDPSLRAPRLGEARSLLEALQAEQPSEQTRILLQALLELQHKL